MMLGLSLGLTRVQGGGEGGVATDAFHGIGDSMWDNGLLKAQIESHFDQPHTFTVDGVGGSALSASATRFASTPQHYGKKLIIADAMAAGNGDVDTVTDMVTRLTDPTGFLYIREPVHEDLVLGHASRDVIEAAMDGIAAEYPDNYVDCLAVVTKYGNGTQGDNADIVNGLWPRSFRSDGVHKNTYGQAISGQIIASSIIAKGWDGERTAENLRVPVISSDGTTLTAFEGIWAQYPVTAATYQWKFNGAVIVGETDPTYTLTGTEEDAVFTVDVTRGGVTATSAPFYEGTTPETAYSAETNALINAMTVHPDAELAEVIDGLMPRVQALIGKVDVFCAPLHNEQASRINWLDPSQVLSPIGEIEFTPMEGWTFPAADGFLQADFYNPATAGGLWTEDSVHVGVDIVEKDPDEDAGVMSSSDSTMLFRPSQYAGVGPLFTANGASVGGGMGMAGNTGHLVMTYTATEARSYASGVSGIYGDPQAITTSSRPNGFLRVGIHNKYDGGIIGGFHWGGTLLQADALELADILADLRAGELPPPETTIFDDVFASGALGLWIDPADAATNFTDLSGISAAAVGDQVARSNDKSPNGHNFVQSTTVYRPLRGQTGDRYYFTMDGVNDGLATSGAVLPSSASIFMVLKTTDTSFALLNNNGGNQYVGVTVSGGGAPVDSFVGASTSYHVNNGSALTKTRDALYVALATGNVCLLEVRAANLSAWATPNLKYENLEFAGQIGDLVICQSDRADTYRTDIVAYFADKHGISL